MSAVMNNVVQESFPEVFTWVDPKSDTEVKLRRMTLEHDLDMIHEWMNYPHVAEFWLLDKPIEVLREHYIKALADDHHRLYIVSINGKEIAYTEIYHAIRDRLGEKYEAHPDDWGWHLLIGPKDQVGAGLSEAIIRGITHFIFESTNALKVVGEPDHRVKPYIALSERMGYEDQGFIQFPEKKAILFYCYKDRFYKLNQI